MGWWEKPEKLQETMVLTLDPQNIGVFSKFSLQPIE
jgi:hypothetical protein